MLALVTRQFGWWWKPECRWADPRVSQSGNDPMTCTVVVLGLTNTGSGGTPDEEAVALGAGLVAGRV